MENKPRERFVGKKLDWRDRKREEGHELTDIVAKKPEEKKNRGNEDEAYRVIDFCLKFSLTHRQSQTKSFSFSFG